MSAFLDMIPDILKIIGLLISAFAVVATMTPNEADNVVADKLAKTVNALAMNFGKSANK
jgi:hypothetical protein